MTKLQRLILAHRIDKFNVTLSLEHCTASNTSNKAGSTYENTLTASGGYTLSNEVGKIGLITTVTMGGNDITSTVFTAATGVISIAEVTGDITITVEADAAH